MGGNIDLNDVGRNSGSRLRGLQSAVQTELEDPRDRSSKVW